MFETSLYLLGGLPAFLLYFASGIILLLLFVAIYTKITPHDELALIRANNTAAALALGGAIIGFALPMASAISHSVTLLDCVLWGLVALIIQALTFVVLRMMVSELPKRITNGEMAPAIFTAATAIAVGLINAACMTY
ncbi:MAG: DUF350 domain-containing protein [Pseudomonadota bacterium]